MIAVTSTEATRISNDEMKERSENNPVARDRLDGWKEIAAYLRRSARCVQRWERTEGLPVLRHRHTKGATVYAFRREVDQWWAEGIADVSRAWKNRPGSTDQLQHVDA
jgi:hypothetical protein